MNVRILLSYIHVQHHFCKLFPSYKYIYLTAFYVICAHYAAKKKENPFQRRNSLSLKTLQCSKEVVGDGCTQTLPFYLYLSMATVRISL